MAEPGHRAVFELEDEDARDRIGLAAGIREARHGFAVNAARGDIDGDTLAEGIVHQHHVAEAFVEMPEITHHPHAQRAGTDGPLAGQRIERHILIQKCSDRVKIPFVQGLHEAAGNGLRVGQCFFPLPNWAV